MCRMIRRVNAVWWALSLLSLPVIATAATSVCTKPNLEIQVRSPMPNFLAVVGQSVTIEVQVVDACGNLIGPGASVLSTFSNKDADIKLTNIGNGIWSGTWVPKNPSTGSVTIAITAFNPTPGLQSGQITISGTLSVNSPYTFVPSGGVLNLASLVAGAPIAPGTLYCSDWIESGRRVRRGAGPAVSDRIERGAGSSRQHAAPFAVCIPRTD